MADHALRQRLCVCMSCVSCIQGVLHMSSWVVSQARLSQGGSLARKTIHVRHQVLCLLVLR